MLKRSIHLFLVIIILTLSYLPTLALAHNGGRDELGGHFRRADCVYILHEPTPIAKSAANLTELIGLIKKNNSNSSCAEKLSPSTVELEGYTFTGSQSTSPQTGSTPPQVKETVPDTETQLQIGQKYTATLEKCTDGDTANFNINGTIYKTRFLYIDTPESTNQIEPFGKEASDYTCSFLKQGEITIETDGKDLFDKYERLLAWVWVGAKLHQEEITKAGLVEDFYDYGTYKYEDRIISAMENAKTNYTGMFASLKPDDSTKPTDNRSTSESTDKDDSSTESEKVAPNSKENQSEPATKEKEAIENEVESSIDEEKNGPIYTAIIIIILILFFVFYKAK